MNRSHVIYGPQGCGKSRSAQALARHFRLDTIVDTGELPPLRKIEPYGHLYLTTDRPIWASNQDRRVLPFDEAMRQAGLQVEC